MPRFQVRDVPPLQLERLPHGRWGLRCLPRSQAAMVARRRETALGETMEDEMSKSHELKMPSMDEIKAAHRRLTREFWDMKRRDAEVEAWRAVWGVK